jgi:uncharacterized protein YjaZ
MKSKLFFVPLYSPVLFVVVGALSGEDLHQLVLAKFGVSIPELYYAIEDSEGCCIVCGGLIILWVNTLRGPRAVSILAHECLHATSAVMRFSGLKLNEGSEEAYTYLLSWMVETILRWGAK